MAEHDHTLHIDAKFVHGEAMRSAWLSLDELEKNIIEFSDQLQAMNNLCEQNRGIPSNDPSRGFDSVWAERYMEAYRKTADYLLVASGICKDLYADERCTMSRSIWDEKCDQRGDQFLEEFDAEIHDAMHTVVATVKKARKDRQELVEL